jgi:hypothetical protein
MEKIEKNCIERDKKLAESINAVIRQQSLSGQLSTLQTHKEMIAYIYSSASTYSNLIMLGGYAGVFALWQLTKNHLSKQATLITAFLMSISILLFVGYEIYKMIHHSWFFRRLNKLLISYIKESERIDAWKIAWQEYSRLESRVWIFFLVPTVLTGFGAGILLLNNYLINLW